MNISKSILLILVGLAAAGCSTNLIVKDVSPSANVPVGTLDGIPFRIPVDQKVTVYLLKDDLTTGDSYVEVASTIQPIADQGRLFSVGMKGKAFATATLHAIEAQDNTLTKVELTTTNNTSAVTDSVTGALAANTTNAASKATAATTAKTTALTNANAILTADKAVLDAQSAIDALPSDTPPETLAYYQQILASAKAAAAAARAVVGQ